MDCRARWFLVGVVALAGSGCIYTFDDNPLGLKEGDVTGVARGVLPGETDTRNLTGVQVLVDGLALRRSTDAHGRFILRNLPEGTHTLTLQLDTDRDGKADLARRLTVSLRTPAGRARRPAVDLGNVEMWTPGTIEVSVTGEHAPATEVVSLVGYPVVSRPDASGVLRTLPLGEGTWTLVAGARAVGGTGVVLSEPQDVKVTRGEVTRVSVALVPVSGDGRVHGNLEEQAEQHGLGTGTTALPLEETLDFNLVSLIDGIPPQQRQSPAAYDFTVPVGLYTVLVGTTDEGTLVSFFGRRVSSPQDGPQDGTLVRPHPETEGPCAGHYDVDGDGACGVSAAEAGACADTCRSAGRALSEPCMNGDLPVDCDDDADGQADAEEELGGLDGTPPCHCPVTGGTTCENDPSRSDRDHDGQCDATDPWPDCAFNASPCVAQGRCGDGTLQEDLGEQCEPSLAAHPGDCTAGCKLTVEAGLELTALDVPSALEVGQLFDVTVTLTNTLGDCGGLVVALDSTVASDVLPEPYVFQAEDHGTHVFTNLALLSTGERTLTASAAVTGRVVSRTAVLAPAAGAVKSLLVDGPTTPVPAGTPVSFTVTGKNGSGAALEHYTGPVTVEHGDTLSGLAGPVTLDAAHQFTAKAHKATTATLVVADVADPNVRVTRELQVVPGDVATLEVQLSDTAVDAGQTVTVTVTVKDGEGNVVTHYAGTLVISSPSASGPVECQPSDWANGVCTKGLTLEVPGESVQVSLDVPGTNVHATRDVRVDPGTADRLVVTASPLPPYSGTDLVQDQPFTVSVEAFAGQYLATGFAGAVTLTESGNTWNADAVAGRATFSGQRLHVLGTHTFTARTTGLADATRDVNVVAQGLAAVRVTMDATFTAGDPITGTLEAVDDLGVVNPNFAADAPETVQLWLVNEDMGARTAVFPAGSQGTTVFNFGEFTAAGPHELLVTTSGDPGVQGSTTFTILPGPPDSLALFGLPEMGATSTPMTAMAPLRDVYGNTVPNQPGITLDLTDTVSGKVRTLTPDAPATDRFTVMSRTPRSWTAVAHYQSLTSNPWTVNINWSFPTVSNVRASPGNCVDVSYTITEAGSAPATVGVEYLGPEGEWHRATQAGSDDPSIQGTAGVPTAAAGRVNRFLWNAAADLPAYSGPTQVRVSASGHGNTTWSNPVDLTLSGGLVLAQPGTSLALTRAPAGVVAVDLDHDGHTDVVVALADGSGVVVYRQGAAGLSAGTLVAFGDGLAAPATDVATGDINQDGHPDILVSRPASNGTQGLVTILLGKGDGTFRGASSMVVSTLRGDVTPATVDVVNLRGPGHEPLLATGDQLTGALTLTGLDGGIVNPSSSGLSEVLTVVVADIDRNGLTEVLMAGGSSTHVTIIPLDNFGNPSTFTTAELGHPAQRMVVADVDRDGTLDLVVASPDPFPGNPSQGLVVLVRGGGANGWTPPLEIPVDVKVTDLALADLDRDGWLDLVVQGPDGHVLVLPSLRGSAPYLGASQPVAALPAAGFLALADVDGDGWQDVVLATATPELRVLRNPRQPICEPQLRDAPVRTVEDARADDAVTLDINGDGKPDVLTLETATGLVSLWQGLGNGKFATPTQLQLQGRPGRMFAVDATGDGHLDLVTNESTDGKTLTLRAAGTGTSLAPARTLTLLNAPTAFAFVDLDQDDEQDLVYVADAGGGVTLVGWLPLQGGQPRGSEVSTTLTPATAARVADLAVADVDNDGAPELLVLSGDGTYVYVNGVERTADGMLSGAGIMAQQLTQERPLRLDVLDRGSPEFLVTCEAGSVLLLQWMEGAYRLGAQTSFPMTPDRVLRQAVLGTEPAELVGINNDAGAVMVLSFQESMVWDPLRMPTYGTGTVLAAGDFQGTGMEQLLLAHGGAPQGMDVVAVNPSWPGGPAVYAGALDQVVLADFTGDGELDLVYADPPVDGTPLALVQAPYDPLATATAAGSAFSGITALVAWDYTGDGRKDLAVFTDAELEVQTYYGGQEPPFGSLASGTQATGSVTQAVAADVNGDGQEDLVTNAVTGLPCWITRGTYFPAATTIADSGPSAAVAVGDLNHDGWPDLVFARTDGLGVHLNDAFNPGNFFNALRQPDQTDLLDVAVADLDGDGLQDVVATNSAAVWWYAGKGDGQLKAPVKLLDAPAARVRAADLDRDGRLDVVVADRDGVLQVLAAGSSAAWLTTVFPGDVRQLEVADLDRDGFLDVAVLVQDPADGTRQLFTLTAAPRPGGSGTPGGLP